MGEIRKIYFTVCVNSQERQDSAMGELAFIAKVLELRKQYRHCYFAIKNVYKSDTTVMGNTYIIRKAG